MLEFFSFREDKIGSSYFYLLCNSPNNYSLLKMAPAIITLFFYSKDLVPIFS